MSAQPDFLTSLTNTLVPFDVAGAGSDTPTASGNPVNNPTGITPSTTTTPTASSTSSTSSTGFVGWFEGVIVQIAAIFLGLILVAIALIMIAMRNGPSVQVEGKVTP